MSVNKSIFIKRDREFDNLSNTMFCINGEMNEVSFINHDNEFYSFPMDEFQSVKLETYQHLFDKSSKATFGLNNEHVLDEDYRKAKTLKTEEFVTTFDTNKVMKEAIALFEPKDDRGEYLSIERYRLNMYSQGGMFKAHKDTPRDTEFIGTLVVCLPYAFTGGNLYLKNKNEQIKLEWDKNSDKLHQWVMFYGDVTHWIDEVTSGIRFTITYNIYKRKKEQIINDTLFCEKFSNFVDKYLTNEYYEDDKYKYSCCKSESEDSSDEEEQKEQKVIKKDNTRWFAIPLYHMYIKDIKEKRKFDLYLKGVDEKMYKILKGKEFEVELGFCVSTDKKIYDKKYKTYNEFYIVKNICSSNDINLYDRDLGYNFKKNEVYSNVSIINKEKFQVEFLDCVEAYGNEPSIEYIYESILLMVKVAESRE